MSILKKDFTFGIVPTYLLIDKDISLKAKGLYGYMHDKPNDWNFTIASMAKQLLEGKNSINTALKELRSNGWVSYQRLSTGEGQYTLCHDPK